TVPPKMYRISLQISNLATLRRAATRLSSAMGISFTKALAIPPVWQRYRSFSGSRWTRRFPIAITCSILYSIWPWDTHTTMSSGASYLRTEHCRSVEGPQIQESVTTRCELAFLYKHDLTLFG